MFSFISLFHSLLKIKFLFPLATKKQTCTLPVDECPGPSFGYMCLCPSLTLVLILCSWSGFVFSCPAYDLLKLFMG